MNNKKEIIRKEINQAGVKNGKQSNIVSIISAPRVGIPISAALNMPHL
ncbi:hypothetical protein [Pedobacter agri]|nr:hypothetical protein [Pedobacter agri]